jgi:hypothetical protein
MTASLGRKRYRAAAALLLGSFLATADAAPLCNETIERRFALGSRQAFDDFNAAFPEQANNALRERFGDAARASFVFTNRSLRPAASHLLLVLPGSGFHPVYMLRNFERAVPDSTEVAVFEYPYLAPDFNAEGAFADSERIAADIVSGLAAYRVQRPYDSVGVYASSLGGSLMARVLQAGTRVDFLVLDGVQESRPALFVCSRDGWLKDVLPAVLGGLSRVTLISNRDDRKERTKTLRRLPQTDSFTVIELAARHPWEAEEDLALRIPVLKTIFERSL